MAQVLMEVTLELVGPGDVPLGPDAQADRREVDAGAKTLAFGGMDGMLIAVNRVLKDQGYELRRKALSLDQQPPLEPVSPAELERALEDE